MLSRNGKNNHNGSFDWADALADAMIMAGSMFFVVLGAMTVTNLLTGPEGWLAAAIASGGEFFIILAIKRGLREKK